MTPRPWTPDHRDALLTRVTAITTGTAVVGCVGALGLAVGIAATAHAATPTTKAAGSSARTSTTHAGASGTSKSTTTPAGSSGSASTVDPSQVQVEVLNGVGIAGAAHLVADQLRAQGFNIVGIGNAPRTVGQSGIIYSTGQAAAFRTLSSATGVTLSSTQGTGAALILVVGQDWQGSLPAAQAVPQAVPQGGGNIQPQAASGGS
jgi:hypothetical protein